MKIGTIADRFIPENMKSDFNLATKLRLIVNVDLFFIVFSMILFLHSLIIFDFVNIIIQLVHLGLLLSGLFLLKNFGLRQAPANITVAVLFAGLLMGIIERGGISSAVTALLVLIPVCAVMVSGVRFGILWTILSILAIVFMYYFKLKGIVLHTEVRPPELIFKMTMMLYSGIIFSALGLACVFEKINKIAMQKSIVANTSTETINAQLKKAIIEVNTVMTFVADSDLSCEVKYQLDGDLERLKNSVNDTINLLNGTISDVVNSSQILFVSANELAGSAQALADGTSTQAANMEQISSSMNEIEDQTRLNHEAAIESRQIASSALNVVELSNQDMKELVETINRINITGNDVSKVIKIIDDIAFQTNLLSLNAAVEAARAGKFGKGFSVVAEEVRRLARRSAQSVGDATKLIEASTREVEQGVEKTEKTAKTFGKVTESVKRVCDLAGEISIGSNDQNTKIKEMNHALNQVNQVIQQNSAISEETASASQQLSFEASKLQQIMSKFRLRSL